MPQPCSVAPAAARVYLSAMSRPDERGERPRVGLTVDVESRAPARAGHRARPAYELREAYCTAVVEAGGLPLLLPHQPDLAESYLAGLDGLIVTGGAFDVDPALFGASERHPSVVTKERRTDFELAVTRAALERDLPVLGICGGQQLLNVAFGGSLIQHIPDAITGALAHEQPNDRGEPGHEVEIVAGSLLHRVCGKTRMAVNSAHHQAVERPGAGLTVSARAPDGVIEAIEAPDRRFCLGVQWHPEYTVDPADEKIFAALVAAAGGETVRPLAAAQA